MLNGGAEGLFKSIQILRGHNLRLLNSSAEIRIFDIHQSDNVTIKSIDDLRGKNVGVEVSVYPNIA